MSRVEQTGKTDSSSEIWQQQGSILDAVSAGVVVCGLRGEVRFCNKTGRSLLGLRDNLPPDTPLECLTEGWICEAGPSLSVAQWVQQAIATKTAVQDVVVGVPQTEPGAAVTWLKLSIQPLFAITEQAAVCTLIDITEQRQAMTQGRSQIDYLQEQLDKRTMELRTFVNALPDYICVIERDGLRYSLCNERLASNTTAQSPQELEGQSIYDCYPAAVANYYAEQNLQVLATGEPLHVQEKIELPDKTLYLDTYKIPLKTPNGEVYALLVASRDVADLALARQELVQRTEQLEVINRELESFSYSVSHDLRAPLRHISGFVAALSDRLSANGWLDDPKVAHYLNTIRNSSRKMGLLIDRLLDLSRVTRRSLVQRPVSLRPLVDRAIALATSDEQPSPPVEFVIGDLPTVLGDATLLQQVFANLIDNAVKFSRPMPQPRVEIGCLPDHTLFVRDNGVGFPPKFTDQIFGAFQRLHPEHEFEGMGIGLALVQRIILRHGGKIWAESQPGQGSTLYFTLQSSAVCENRQ
jgi:signal transduction histidine kinase